MGPGREQVVGLLGLHRCGFELIWFYVIIILAALGFVTVQRFSLAAMHGLLIVVAPQTEL